MANGVLITLEGTEGAGKSTQVRLLAEWLENMGLPVAVTREPGAGKIGMQIREVLLNPENAGLCAEAEALLMAADRAQHAEEFLRPNLAAGKIVLCDRYIDSHIAYQGYGRGLDVAWLKQLNEHATAGLWPNLTLLLDLPPEAGLKRAKMRGAADRMEQEQVDFHRRIYAGFAAIAAEEPLRVRPVAADRAVAEVQRDLQKEVLALLRRKGLVDDAVR